MCRITVLKFGSSVLRSAGDLPRVVHEIYRVWRGGSQVLAVVSALGDTTDQLLRSAETVCAQPEESAVAMLLATGEATASALLGIALAKAGIPAKVLDPAQAGLRTIGDRLDAELVSVDATRLRKELQDSVIVLPGFVGRDEEGGTTLLGRGGSDLTALFLAHELQAECVLIKDVDGLYTSDPAEPGATALRFAQTKYETALRVGGPVVQAKAVRFAATCGLRFTITCAGASGGTEVGSDADHPGAPERPAEPLRVALLGCGTVGGGVYERIVALPELFGVTGVAVRDLDRVRSPSIPPHLITNEPEALIEKPCDVVIELIGGADEASVLVKRALRFGRHVVTANKAMMAVEAEQLEALALENGVSISASAAVGGALPALETIAQAKSAGSIIGFSGVLNGTTNVVLDRLAQGEELKDAVLAAQRAGYAEADATLDLNGTDAAQKLILLARAAFGESLPFRAVARGGIEGLSPPSLRKASERGWATRLVASCRRTAKGLEANVSPIELPSGHPLAQVRGAQNRLIIDMEDGPRRIVSGTGAGRWPTTEAVIADLLEIQREFSRARSVTEELEQCVA